MKSKVKVLLLVGGAPYHDQPEHREVLSSMLGSKFDLTMAGYPDRTLSPENLSDYDVIADYTSWWEPSRPQYLAQFNEEIKNGTTELVAKELID